MVLMTPDAVLAPCSRHLCRHVERVLSLSQAGFLTHFHFMENFFASNFVHRRSHSQLTLSVSSRGLRALSRSPSCALAVSVRSLALGALSRSRRAGALSARSRSPCALAPRALSLSTRSRSPRALALRTLSLSACSRSPMSAYAQMAASR